jgi:ssDNA-binding Zn-finger/Zn-ribbon topoisomerase 1
VRFKLFTFAAASSLALAAVVLVLWMRSYSMAGMLMFQHYTDYPDCDLVHEWRISSAAGGVCAAHHINHFQKGEGPKLPRWTFWSHRGRTTYPFFGTRSLLPSRNHLTFWQRAGFELGNSATGTPPSVIRGIIVPYWFCILLLLFLPTLWLRYGLPHLRARRRAAANLCPTCGYDLRATPQGRRCPECGTAPAEQATAAIAPMR